MTDTRVGRVLHGRYRLIAQLAEGGMGVVYKAERVGIGRPVVVKFLHAMLTDRPGIVDRFEREARATASMNHPNCVGLVDFGLEDGAPFLVMELADGRTLADILDDGPLATSRAVHIIHQVLAGLAHAHERGILHRDLKPANVMITDYVGARDFVKILDFGLAKMMSPLPGDKRDVTIEGIAIGTPGYMSPEQAAGTPADRRADIYCTGALLYHMVTGAKAFESEDLHSLLRRHREETPALPSAVVPKVGISVELEGVILRAMQREPAARFQTADEMMAAVALTPEALRPTAAPVPPVATPSRPGAEPTRAEAPASRARARSAHAGAAWKLVALGALAGGVIAGSAAWRLASQRTPSAAATAAPTPPIVATTPRTPPAEPAVVSMPLPAPMPPPPGVAAPSPSPSPAAAPDAPGDPGDPGDSDGAGEDDRTPPPEVAPTPRRELPPVRTVADARALVKSGDSDAALAGLYRLQRAKPAPRTAADIATLIGHIYFDRRWWSDGLKEYRFALTLDPRSRSDAQLLGDAVRALGDRATYPRARRLLVEYVGRPAAPWLRRAARSGSPLQRKNAQAVLASLEKSAARRK